MNIILEGSDAVVGTRAIRRYAISLMAHLPSIGKNDRFTVFLNFFRGDAGIIQGKIVGMGNARVVRWACPRHLSLPLWHHLSFPPIDYFAGRADVFHSLGDDCPPVRSGTYIMTLHGIIYMSRPDLIDPRYVREKRTWLQKAVQRSHYFISVSETTKAEFLSYFPRVEPERVRVIPLGIGPEFHRMDRTTIRATLRERFDVCRPYLLYVGGLQAHKNINGIIRGFSQIAHKHTDVELILVGKEKEDPVDVRALIANLRLQDRVRIHPYINQEDNGLPLLYNGAACFVFPSFVEGWTSPPLEAMACGAPVVTSNVSSLPETVGDAAVTVDPTSPEDIGHALDRLLTDSALRATLRAKGLQRASRFTWKRCAESTHAFYREVAAAR